MEITKKETEIIEFNELKIQELHKKLLKYKKLIRPKKPIGVILSPHISKGGKNISKIMSL